MQPVRLNLDLDKEPQERYVLSIRQGEVNATQLEVEITDHGEAVDLSGYGVFFECAHPNGALHSEKVGSTSGNVAAYTVAKAVGDEAGTIECAYFALKTTNEGGTTEVYATTQAFLIRVLPNAQQEGAKPRARPRPSAPTTRRTRCRPPSTARSTPCSKRGSTRRRTSLGAW